MPELNTLGGVIKTTYENEPNANAFTDAEKAKLNLIADGATANASDAQLRDRSTHTGTQAASTISGLASVATSGNYGDLTGLPGSFPPSAHNHTLSEITDAGTAASQSSGAFATAAQGSRADSALQPGANVSALANDAQFVASNPAGITGAVQLSNVVEISQADYDALSPPPAGVLFAIVG